MLSIALSCYLLYSSSKRIAVATNLKFQSLLQKKSKISKLLGLAVLTSGILVAIDSFGLGAGIFTVILAMMVLWSLLVLLVPLQIVNYKHIFLLIISLSIINYFN